MQVNIEKKRNSAIHAYVNKQFMSFLEHRFYFILVKLQKHKIVLICILYNYVFFFLQKSLELIGIYKPSKNFIQIIRFRQYDINI